MHRDFPLEPGLGLLCASGIGRRRLHARSQRSAPARGTQQRLSAGDKPAAKLNGCVEDWTWCDVDSEGNRGGVYANCLYYDYQNSRVPIIEYGPRLGLTIELFSVGDYWGRYYAGRPWYGQRDR